MTTVLAILGSLGGVAALITAVVIIVRAIFSQVHATLDNTRAMERVTGAVNRLDGKLDDHAERIARLEGRL